MIKNIYLTTINEWCVCVGVRVCVCACVRVCVCPCTYMYTIRWKNIDISLKCDKSSRNRCKHTAQSRNNTAILETTENCSSKKINIILYVFDIYIQLY